MNNTPNLPANGLNGTNKNGSNGTAPKPQPLSALLADAKKTETGNGSDIKEPTKYPAPADATKAEATTPEALAKPVETPAPVQPVTPVRSRSEEIQFQVEKALKLQSINNQLVSLRGKLADLKQFSYHVDEDENRNYGRLSIFDDANREFNCKHHGLAEMVVEFLMAKFESKIVEKENELLLVSRS